MTQSPIDHERHNLQRKTITTLTTAQSLTGLGVASTVAAGSLLVASISHSETLAGLAQTFSVLGAAVMALPLANLTRRGGRRLALSTGFSVGALGSVTAITAGALRILPLMLLGTFMVGAASAASYQARYAAVDLATDDTRASNLSRVVWASTIGAVLGPNLMAPSGRLAAVLGLPKLTGPYILAATMLALGALIIWTRLRPDPYLANVDSERKLTATEPVKMSTPEVLRVIRQHPRALLGLLAVAIGHIAMVSVMVMTPVHMAHAEVTLKIIGLVISVHILGMYALSPLVGRMADRLGRRRVIQIGGLILLAAVLIAGTAPEMHNVQLGVGLFLLGLGWSCTLVAGSTLLSESVPTEVRASVQGTSDLFMNLSGAIGGASAGVIIATLSYGWLCAIAAVPVLLVTIYATVQLDEAKQAAAV